MYLMNVWFMRFDCVLYINCPDLPQSSLLYIWILNTCIYRRYVDHEGEGVDGTWAPAGEASGQCRQLDWTNIIDSDAHHRYRRCPGGGRTMTRIAAAYVAGHRRTPCKRCVVYCTVLRPLPGGEILCRHECTT